MSRGQQKAGCRVLAKSACERGWRGSVPAKNRSLAALVLSFCFLFLASGLAQAETRSLKLYFIHTKERAEITYKRNGKYIQSGLDQINRFLRDWRRNEPAKMDPRLLDLVWEVYRNVGARDYIHVVSAYRSPATNSMLRSRSKGVAKTSQHMLGKALDFYIPGVPLAKLRAAGFKAEVGGVGYYPTSGAPFVHLDVGNVRAWPRMKRDELMALFPDGRTIHLPADGKPLAGYQMAMASYKARKQNGGAIQIASVAESSGKPKRGFLSSLFGGADEEEDVAESSQVVVASAPAPARQPVLSAPAAVQPAIQPSVETPEAILAAMPAVAVPVPLAAPRPKIGVGEAIAVATAAPVAAPVPVEAAAANMAFADLALDVPIPTRRPTYVAPMQQSTQVAAADAAGAAAQIAAVATGGDGIVTGKVPLPGDATAALAAYVPIPTSRPVVEQDVLIAALPRSGAAHDLSVRKAEIARAEANGMVDQRLARLAAAPGASPRLAVIAREAGIAPESAISVGPKTTAKAAKPSATDGMPDPRSVPMPVPQRVARWALSNEPVLMDTRGTKAPSFAHAAVREAPRMVYTAGFQAPMAEGSGNRFSGKAVSFLPVARFK